eukprot:gnl/MRDRNA2_/MRDRNA2_139190_c0_seq1.p1 gnl/MRDRNA2_/MRDRNA2_139190_c0~~gnl/MRDRNA2_/MRDRNA2_139190_c0_seq1.p1  ORF type:complete len:194 (+),score=39.93 gnl/MRDRNA2_/MRDRNA2_139190_c0_seq1:78-659(+)
MKVVGPVLRQGAVAFISFLVAALSVSLAAADLSLASSAAAHPSAEIEDVSSIGAMVWAAAALVAAGLSRPIKGANSTTRIHSKPQNSYESTRRLVLMELDGALRSGSLAELRDAIRAARRALSSKMLSNDAALMGTLSEAAAALVRFASGSADEGLLESYQNLVLSAPSSNEDQLRRFRALAWDQPVYWESLS